MNSILMKHRPLGDDGKQVSKEDWEKTWNNATYILEPLLKTLREMKESKGKVDATDFDTPNHYAKLVAELVEAQTIDKIIALLPKSVTE